jgi:hypothetical protein
LVARKALKNHLVARKALKNHLVARKALKNPLVVSVNKLKIILNMFNPSVRACEAGVSKADWAEPLNSPLKKGRTPKVGVARYYSAVRGRDPS